MCIVPNTNLPARSSRLLGSRGSKTGTSEAKHAAMYAHFNQAAPPSLTAPAASRTPAIFTHVPHDIRSGEQEQ